MPKLKRYWRALQKKEKQTDEEARERARKDSTFMARLINLFLQILSTIPETGVCSVCMYTFDIRPCFFLCFYSYCVVDYVHFTDVLKCAIHVQVLCLRML